MNYVVLKGSPWRVRSGSRAVTFPSGAPVCVFPDVQ